MFNKPKGSSVGLLWGPGTGLGAPGWLSGEGRGAPGCTSAMGLGAPGWAGGGLAWGGRLMTPARGGS